MDSEQKNSCNKLVTKNIVEKCIKNRDDLYNEIFILKNKLSILEEKYNEITKQINTLCNHKWVSIQFSVPFDQKPYQCEICGVLR